MGVFDDIRAKGAAYRLTEEALYAEALREIELGQRRDGLWAKAMAESDMDQGRAGAKYIKLRVQSLKDEVTLFISAIKNAESQQPSPKVAQLESEKSEYGFVSDFRDGFMDGVSKDSASTPRRENTLYDDAPNSKLASVFVAIVLALALVFMISGHVAMIFGSQH